MKKDLIETIKDWNLRVCLATLLLLSLFMFVLGLRLEDTTQFIPWWFALVYGWSGLVVSMRFGSIFDHKD